MMSTGFWTSEKIDWRHWGVLVLLLMLLRAWSFAQPIIDVDESQFAGYAQALLDGGTPYIASVDTKPLGVYWFYAAIFWIFGRFNMIAVHVATACWMGATSFVCYRIARRLAGPRAGFWAALSLVVFTTTYVPKFIGTSIVSLMLLPLAMSIDAMFTWEATGRRRYMLLSGLAWGAACLFKYQAGINLVVAGAWLMMVRPLVVGRRAVADGALAFLLFLAGGVLVGAAYALYLVTVGAWDAFVFWSLGGSAAYVEAGAQQSHFLKGLLLRGGSVVASSLLIWYLAAAEVAAVGVDLCRRRQRPSGESLIVVWLVLSIVPVCMGGKFYGHYFLQLFPALCILGAIRLDRYFASAAAYPRRFRRWAMALIALGMIFPAAGFTAARIFSDRIYRALGEENPKEYLSVGAYLREATAPTDRIFVWGFATPIYFYAERSAASRFLWCDWLTGRVSGTPAAKDPRIDTSAYIMPGSWAMFFEDMERARPAYVVDTSPGNHHDYGKYPLAGFPALVEWLGTRYRYETTIDGMALYRRVVP